MISREDKPTYHRSIIFHKKLGLRLGKLILSYNNVKLSMENSIGTIHDLS